MSHSNGSSSARPGSASALARSILVSVLASTLSVTTTGCSFFGPRTQAITISSDPSGAEAFIDGEPVGRTPVQHTVERRGDLLIEVRQEGYETAYRRTQRTLSTHGMTDLIGGWLILLPFLGLLSSAAWEQEPSSFGIVLDPVTASGTTAGESVTAPSSPPVEAVDP